MKRDILRELEANIISWYDFKENSKILYCGEKENAAYEYLKKKYINVNFWPKDEQKNDFYDYIVMLKEKINIEEIVNLSKKLKDKGIFLIAFDNPYGISKFVTYKYNSRISPLQQVEKTISKNEIEKALKEEGYNYINMYMSFPNWKLTDVILTDKINDISQKIDKYFVSYSEEDVVLLNEINLLKNIATYDKEMFIKLSNSYLLEVSKEPINTDAKYISFNNYRKKEYQLTTIIKDNIVEKKPTTREAIKNIEKIAKNMEKLKEYEFEILDKYENNKLYSKFIKDYETLDIQLARNCNNEEYIIDHLNNIKEILNKNSVKYNKKDRKYYNTVLSEQKEEILQKFNYLEYAFYDMVPKNCFYIENKYYFFDQEWMEKYLPVEFIIYRSIINSYDLVRNIDVDNLLEKMELKQYRKIFEQLDKELRRNIIDVQKFNELNKNYKKMYEVIYENEVLKIENAAYKENDIKQNEYIRQLENRINKK